MARKFSRRQMHLRETVSVTSSFHGHNGSRPVFGEVTLSAASFKVFSFVSCVTWQVSGPYEECVLDGILDVLVSADFHPICGVRFTLENIGWNEDSVPVGYYFAARDATRKILRLDEDERNFVC
ncbi:MAG: hypothetical protein ACM33V_08790 [Chloroflexota bacterium]|nr:hypothetical protein [Anaerolineales bacterium]